MESYEREYFLSRIIAGYTRFKDNNTLLKIKHPTIDIIYESNEIYLETYKNALNNDIITDEDALELLINSKEWTLEDEENLKVKIPEDITKFQEGLYHFAHKPKEAEKTRKYLAVARQKLNELLLIRSKYDSFTCHGIASYARYNFIIENSVYDYSNILYNWKEIGITDIIKFNNDNSLSPDCIRELSRTTPWTNQWSAFKANGNIFPVSGVELSTSQQLLLMWTKMYDSIYESGECPEDFILKDDDMLDGWLITQKKKNKEQKAKNASEFYAQSEKIRNAQEVYIIAEDTSDIDRINNLNSQRSQEVKQQRLNKVQTQGTVAQQEFADVQKLRTMQLTEQFSRTMKGK